VVENREALGQLIRAQRLKLGFTLQHVSDEVGLSQSLLSKIERGVGDLPGTPKLVKLSQVLELDADSLLAFVGRMTPERWQHFWSGVLNTHGITGLKPADQQRFVAVQMATIKEHMCPAEK
jgi:transcriptional regulator with XRE-family HTH domain